MFPTTSESSVNSARQQFYLPEHPQKSPVPAKEPWVSAKEPWVSAKKPTATAQQHTLQHTVQQKSPEWSQSFYRRWESNPRRGTQRTFLRRKPYTTRLPKYLSNSISTSVAEWYKASVVRRFFGTATWVRLPPMVKGLRSLSIRTKSCVSAK